MYGLSHPIWCCAMGGWMIYSSLLSSLRFGKMIQRDLLIPAEMIGDFEEKVKYRLHTNLFCAVFGVF